MNWNLKERGLIMNVRILWQQLGQQVRVYGLMNGARVGFDGGHGDEKLSEGRSVGMRYWRLIISRDELFV